MGRKVEIERKTRETKIALTLDLDDLRAMGPTNNPSQKPLEKVGQTSKHGMLQTVWCPPAIVRQDRAGGAPDRQTHPCATLSVYC